jgi:hypothetical protein
LPTAAGKVKGALRNFFAWKNLKILILFGVVYAALSFGTSFLGFLSPQTPVALHEHVSIHAFEEFGGHFLFGAAAAIPFLDLDLIFLSGVFAVLIDTDHILDALGFYVSGRPDHSFFYAAFSGVVLYYVARRTSNVSKEREVKFAFLGPVVLLSHISFDVFGAYAIFVGGYYFPLYAPFNFSTIPLQYYYWVVFEVGALLIALCGLYLARRTTAKTKGIIEPAKNASDPPDVNSQSHSRTSEMLYL